MTRRTIVIAGLAAELLAAVDASSQSRTTFVPAVMISAEYDDNPFSIADGGVMGDYMTVIRPSVDGFYEARMLNLQGQLSFDMQQSAHYPSLDNIDARRHAAVDGRVRPVPSTMLGVVTSYDRTDTPSDLNADSAVIVIRQRATRWQLTPSLAYRLNTRTTFSAQYDWTTESLERGLNGDLHVARFGIAHQRTPRTLWGGRYLERYFANSPQAYRSHAATVGWSREISPGTSLSMQAGPRFSSSDGVDAEVQVAFVRRTPRRRLVLDYSQSETIVLGVPGPVGVHRGTSQMTWLLRRNFDFSARIGAFKNTSFQQLLATVYSAGLVGSWRPHDPYTISVAYDADYQRGDLTGVAPTEYRIRRQVVMLRLTISPRVDRVVKGPEGADPLAQIINGAQQ